MQQRSIKFNTAMSLLNTIARMAMPLITFPYTSRVLGPEGSGKIAFAVATTQWLVIAATAGLSVYATREIAKIRHDQVQLAKTAREFFILNLGCVLAAFAAFGLCFLFLPRLQVEPQLMLAYGVCILFAIGDLSWFFQGREDYGYTTSRNLLAQALVVAGIFLLIHQSHDYVMVGYLTLATGALTSLSNLRRFLHQLPPLPAAWRLEPRRHFRPIGFTTAWYSLGAIYLVADIQMLGWLTDDHSTGLYNTATRLTRMTLALLTCLSGILMPRLTHCLERGDHREYERLCNLSFRFIWIFGLPAIAGILLLAPDLIQALAGQRFQAAIPIICWMAPLILLVAMRDFVASNILYPNHQEKKMFRVTLLTAFMLPALGIWLVPDAGNPPLIMAGILVGVESLNVFCLFFLARRFIHFDWCSRDNMMAIVNTSIMAGAVLAVLPLLSRIPDSGSLTLAAAIHVCGAVAAGAGVYIALLLWQKDPLLLVSLKPYWHRWQGMFGRLGKRP